MNRKQKRLLNQAEHWGRVLEHVLVMTGMPRKEAELAAKINVQLPESPKHPPAAPPRT